MMKLAFAVLALAHVSRAEEAEEAAADGEAEVSVKEQGLAHLEETAKKEGVVKLESGLLYEVLEKGDGIHAPKVGSKCNVTYAGRLIDGTQFDAGTTTFAPNQVIKGWTEAMQLMVEGDKWQLTIPSELAYGERGSPPKIPGDSVLVFDMKINNIVEGEPRKRLVPCDVNTLANCNDEEKEVLEKYKELDLAGVKNELKQYRAKLKKTLKPGQYEVEEKFHQENFRVIKKDMDVLKLMKKNFKASAKTEL